MSTDPLAIPVKKGEKQLLKGSTILRGSSQSVYPVVYFILLFMVIVLCFE